MPPELSDHLARDVGQRRSPGRRSSWEAAMHDDAPTRELLRGPGDEVDRESTRVVVLHEHAPARRARPARPHS